MHILIADDHHIFREGLAALLNGLSFVSSVSQAANGKEVKDVVATKQIDTILMDIEMPIINGIDATKAIKQSNPTINIIALTMFSNPKDIKYLYGIGIDGYLLKDSSIKEVERALVFVQEGNQYFSKEAEAVITEATYKKSRYTVQEELTTREKEILALICKQMSTEEIADQLFLSPLTINNHRRNIIYKTGAKNIVGLVLYAINNNIYKV